MYKTFKLLVTFSVIRLTFLSVISCDNSEERQQQIGNSTKQTPHTNYSFELQDGDTIYLFSDRYSDQFGRPDNRKYKTKHLKAYLLSIQNENMKTQHKLLERNFNLWIGSQEQIDDVCVWGYQYKS